MGNAVLSENERLSRAELKDFMADEKIHLGDKYLSDAVKLNLMYLGRKCKSLKFHNFCDPVAGFEKVRVDIAGCAINIQWHVTGNTEITVWTGRDLVAAKKWDSGFRPERSVTERIVALMFKILNNQMEIAIYKGMLDGIAVKEPGFPQETIG